MLLIAQMLVQRRWSRIGLWLLVSVVVSAVLGTVIYWASASALVADEQYDWTGWPTIWLVGAYVTTWIAALAWLLRSLLRLVIRRGRANAAGQHSTHRGAAANSVHDLATP